MKVDLRDLLQSFLHPTHWVQAFRSFTPFLINWSLFSFHTCSIYNSKSFLLLKPQIYAKSVYGQRWNGLVDIEPNPDLCCWIWCLNERVFKNLYLSSKLAYRHILFAPSFWCCSLLQPFLHCCSTFFLCPEISKLMRWVYPKSQVLKCHKKKDFVWILNPQRGSVAFTPLQRNIYTLQ